MALTAADWARRKGLGEQAVNHARTYALMAERRVGELLKPGPRNPGTRTLGGGGGKNGGAGGTMGEPPADIPTLSELGISKNESSQAQRLAEVPEPVFQELCDGKVTRGGALRQAQQARTGGGSQKGGSRVGPLLPGVFFVSHVSVVNEIRSDWPGGIRVGAIDPNIDGDIPSPRQSGQSLIPDWFL